MKEFRIFLSTDPKKCKIVVDGEILDNVTDVNLGMTVGGIPMITLTLIVEDLIISGEDDTIIKKVTTVIPKKKIVPKKKDWDSFPEPQPGDFFTDDYSEYLDNLKAEAKNIEEDAKNEEEYLEGLQQMVEKDEVPP